MPEICGTILGRVTMTPEKKICPRKYFYQGVFLWLDQSKENQDYMLTVITSVRWKTFKI